MCVSLPTFKKNEKREHRKDQIANTVQVDSSFVKLFFQVCVRACQLTQ